MPDTTPEQSTCLLSHLAHGAERNLVCARVSPEEDAAVLVLEDGPHFGYGGVGERPVVRRLRVPGCQGDLDHVEAVHDAVLERRLREAVAPAVARNPE